MPFHTPTTQQSLGETGFLEDIQKLTRLDKGHPRIRVAVLDGPVDYSHPCLANAHLVPLDDLGTPVNQRGDSAQHGTHIASLLFGQPGTEIQGIAPRCHGLIATIFHDDSRGNTLPCTQQVLATSLTRAVDAGAHIVNISAGQLAGVTGPSTALSEALLYCERNNVLIVAAAGNDGCEHCLHIPGGIPSPAVLAVGAMDALGEPLPSSNRGAVYQNQGILALGKDIEGALPGARIGRMTGTSFAAALVSGVAAICLSLQLRSGQKPDPQFVRSALLKTASGCDIPDNTDCRLLRGRLNIPRALRFLHTTGVMFMPNTDDTPVLTSMGSNTDVPASTMSRALDDAPSGVERPPLCPERRVDYGVLPSACGCGGGGSDRGGSGVDDRIAAASTSRQLVYVIGDSLYYDFGTRVREESMDDSFASQVLDRGLREHSLRNPVNILRYLLGWDGVTGTGRNNGQKVPVGGSFYDVKSLHWVLYRNGCPIYVIQPRGMFAEAAYKQLVYFFIENVGVQLQDHGISPRCLDEYFDCHGGSADRLPQSDSLPSVTESEKQPPSEQTSGTSDDPFSLFLGESPSKVSKIAIAGEIVGKVQLSTGDVVDALSPDLRGTASWNTARLLQVAAQALQVTGAPNGDRASRTLIARVLSQLYKAAKNKGTRPEDRAKNWVSTSLLYGLRSYLMDGTFAAMLGGLENVACSGVTVNTSDCLRTGMEYDVDVGFYSFENTLRGEVVLTCRVDVSEVVPVTLGGISATTKR